MLDSSHPLTTITSSYKKIPFIFLNVKNNFFNINLALTTQTILYYGYPRIVAYMTVWGQFYRTAILSINSTLT